MKLQNKKVIFVSKKYIEVKLIKLLSKLGARVTAITGKPKLYSFLKNLGAQTILDREDFLNSIKKITINYQKISSKNLRLL